MDDFSWFIGLFEGEGTSYYDKSLKTCVIEIRMCDEDTISKAASFMNTKYRVIPYTIKENYKGNVPIFISRIRGKKAINLLEKIKPFLSKRRGQQVDNVFSMYDMNKK